MLMFFMAHIVSAQRNTKVGRYAHWNIANHDSRNPSDK